MTARTATKHRAQSSAGGVMELVAMAGDHVRRGDLETAAAIYRQALTRAPADPGLHRTLGLVRFEQGRTDAALFHLGRSLEFDPHSAVTYRSMGDALAAAEQPALARAAFEKACGIDPRYADAWLQLGNLLHAMDRYARSAAAYEKIIAMAPDNVQALNNLGKVYHDMGRLHSGLDCYRRCLALDPGYAEARFNRAALLLAMGAYPEGWREYEWRFKRSGAANVYPHRHHTPRWQGAPFAGKRLLVHCEQGMGDVLQFARFLPMVKRLGGTLLVEAHAPLVPLLESIPAIDALTALDERRPADIPHDLHIPLMSLPLIFNTTLDTIPRKTPYIDIPSDEADPWQAHIRKDRLNVGLVWSASDLNPGRNCPIERCGAWFRNPGLTFIGLQTGAAAGQLEGATPGRSGYTGLGRRFRHFRDTAAAIRHLDLVVSVDTATAHLAGAMGKPLWVLLPYNADWRWPTECDRNPWYPDARLFRQPGPGDWGPVIDGVAIALGELI